MPTTVTAAPTTAVSEDGSSDGSSEAGRGVGLFAGGVLVGALGLLVAMLAGLNGAIQWLLDQVRPYLPL